jgi:hypothetical protein
MQKEKSSNLFVHNMVSLHVYTHLWTFICGVEGNEMALCKLKYCGIKFKFANLICYYQFLKVIFKGPPHLKAIACSHKISY